MASSSLMCCSSSKIVPARDLTSACSSVFVSSPSSTLPLACGLPVKPASKLVSTTKCALSEEEQTPSGMGRKVLAGVVATGAALAVFTNMAMAAQGPGNQGARRVAEKADSLLKAADKLNNEDAPPRFGPGRVIGAQDPTKISQTAGSGAAAAVDSVQKGAGDAAKGVSDATNTVKKKSGGFFGFGKKESGAVADNAKDALSQAKGKTEEVVGTVKRTVLRDGLGRIRNPANDVASNVQGAVGQAQNKKGQATNAAKDAIGQAQSKTNMGNSGGNVLSSLQEGLQGLKEGVAQSGSDAKNTVTGTLEKTMQ